MKYSAFIFVFFALSIPDALTGQKSGDVSKEKITVSGTIFDPGHKPVYGAQIFVDGLNTGKQTNGIGNFKIKVSTDAKIITAFSTIEGYGQAEIIKDRAIEITLNGDIENLVGFLEKHTDMDAKEIEKSTKVNTYNDIYQMIQNEVPGVLVSGKSIVVQQQNSFFGNSQPLFLVNGVRVNSIDYINPREVKSIKLLKGSYANIYGSEGANGVISITLKSGSNR